MKPFHILRYGAMAAILSLGLDSCGSFSKEASVPADTKVITLADGRKVVVSATPGTSRVTAEKPKKEDKKKDSGKKKSEKKDSKKKTDAKNASKSKKKLTPPADGSSKKDSGKKDRKGKKDQQPVDPTSDRQLLDLGTPSTLVCADDAHDHAAGKPEMTSTVGAPLPAKFSINGEWTVYSVRDKVVTGEERPYITIDLPQKRFYGNNGCNYINGAITVDTEHALQFGNVISTMMACSDAPYQFLINLALSEVRSFDVRHESPVTFLDLEDTTGKTVMVLRRHNMDFLNGAWKVTELNGTPMQEDNDATLTFDTDGLKMHGNTGCNIVNGEMFIDPDKLNSLQLVKLATTLMACPPESRETEFLLALEAVETAVRVDGKIELRSRDGNLLFTLVPLELRDPDQPQ